jgi:hypothetical protein
MGSQSLFSNSYPRWTIGGLAVLVFLLVTPARAQVACKLLQPAELESALKEWASGGKAAQFSGSTANSGGIVLDSCRSEIVRPRGNLQVTVAIIKNHPMDGGDAIRARYAALAREDQWKMKGARFEQKKVGEATCILYGRPAVPAHSACAIPRAKGYVEVQVIAPSQKEVPSMDAVGMLAQKAISRL